MHWCPVGRQSGSASFPSFFLAVLHLRFSYQTKSTVPQTMTVNGLSLAKDGEFIFKEAKGGGERFRSQIHLSVIQHRDIWEAGVGGRCWSVVFGLDESSCLFLECILMKGCCWLDPLTPKGHLSDTYTGWSPKPLASLKWFPSPLKVSWYFYSQDPCIRGAVLNIIELTYSHAYFKSYNLELPAIIKQSKHYINSTLLYCLWNKNRSHIYSIQTKHI